MKWNYNDMWSVEIKAGASFEYKYCVCCSSGQPIRWEQGPNRIFEPKLLTSTTTEQLDDWEHFNVTFSMFYPGQGCNDVMRINGDTEKLGSWNKLAPIVMEKGPEVQWLTGERVRPW
jgi:hypothetical protein